MHLKDVLPESSDSRGKRADSDEYAASIHHQNDASINLSKLIALDLFRDRTPNPIFLELGSTLFGCIEAIEYCAFVLDKIGISEIGLITENVEWHGVDIVPNFNRHSKLIHAGHSISTYLDYQEFNDKTDVFFAKGVSLLYAIGSVAELLQILDRSRLALFDYSFSLGAEKQLNLGTGKKVKYLSAENALEMINKSEFSYKVRKGNSKVNTSNQTIFVDCIVGDPETVDRFIASNASVRKLVTENCPSEIFKIQFLGDNAGFEYDWIDFEQFCATVF